MYYVWIYTSSGQGLCECFRVHSTFAILSGGLILLNTLNRFRCCENISFCTKHTLASAVLGGTRGIMEIFASFSLLMSAFQIFRTLWPGFVQSIGMNYESMPKLTTIIFIPPQYLLIGFLLMRDVTLVCTTFVYLGPSFSSCTPNSRFYLQYYTHMHGRIYAPYKQQFPVHIDAVEGMVH